VLNLGKLSGRVALVTGAGPNIGREIALTLAEEGAMVICNDLNPESAKAAAEYIQQQGYQAAPFPADVSDEQQIEELFQKVESEYGQISILVNNAALTIPKGLLTISFSEWQRCIQVILNGMFLTSRAMAKSLVETGKPGAIVHIASTSGHRGRANAIAYTTAKGGVLNLTRSMAVELAKHGIRVNSVSPTKTGNSVGSIEEAGGRSYNEIPLGRLGRPRDQANAVLFLVSDDAAFITGEDLRVDGGSLATWGTRSHPSETTTNK
jgi:NAD(P)-dependent dehydrogenase (short-subunit alcohol dehydrogenase family)